MFDKGFKFSIIIAIYNCENYLNHAIDSVINQCGDFEKNVQLILVDDGSTDSSKEIALGYQKEYPENIILLSQEHSGVACARNLGLKYAQGEYVNFLDADDYISQNTLYEVSNFFDNNSCDVVAIPINYFERETEQDLFNYKFEKTHIIDLLSNPNNPQFSLSSTFIRLDAITDEFNTELVCSEDILLLYSILIKNPQLGVVSTPTYFYRKRFNLSALSDSIRFKKEYYMHRLKNFHLKLIELSKKDSKVPKFIQYLLLYDLEKIITQEDYFMCDSDHEKEELRSLLKEILLYLDLDVIKSINMEDSLRYCLFNLVYEDLEVQFDNFDSLLKHNGEYIDNLYTPELIFREVDLVDGTIKIKGFLNDFLESEIFSVESLTEFNNGKTERNSADFIPDPSFREIKHSSFHQKLKYFTLEIPFKKNISKISFKLVYHKNGDINNYRDEDLIVFNPKIELKSKFPVLRDELVEFGFDDSQIVVKKKFDFKFAVVMAIYNTENYLHQSIGSVIHQTLGFKNNIQLILVNDGSEDSSEEICLFYKEKYPDNIIVISQENAGQAHARNNGFEKVRAKYTNFLDSDDYLEENSLEEAYNFFEEHYDETDIVSMPIVFFEKESGDHMLNNKYSSSRIIDLTENPNNPQLHSNSAFFKTEVFARFKFATNVVSSEDVIVINKILLEKKTLGVINTSKYFYRKRFDESSTLDKVSTKKEFFTDKLKDYYLHLFNYALSKDGEIPDFLKYTLAYDLQWLLKEDLDILNNQERKEFWHYLMEVISYIDEEMILNNKFIRNEFSMRFFLSLKRNDLHAEYEKDNVLLYIGDHRCGNLASHNIWLDIVELSDGFLNISGFLNSFFDVKNISIEGVKYYDTVAFNRYLAKQVRYTSRPHMTYVSVPFQFKNTFDLKIPLNEHEKCKIKLQINYHKDGNNMNFKPDNVISVNPGVAFTDHVKISNLSNYKADDFHIVSIEHNDFYVYPRTKELIKEFEKKNIECLIKESEKKEGKDLEIYNEIIELRTNYLKDLSKRRLLSRKKEIYLFQDRIDSGDDNAYHLFKYASKIKDNVKKYFVISRDAKQFKELSRIGNVVEAGSIEHKSLILKADKIITTHPYDTQINPFFDWENDERKLISGLLDYKIYWLQHGVTKDNISDWMRKYDKNLSLIVTVCDEESKSFYEEGYGFAPEIVQNLGFPRFDNLKKNKNKQILIIPTWRKTITGNRHIFLNSSYYENLSSFLHNPKLLDMVNKGYSIVFRPHPELFKNIANTEEKFIDLFDIPNEIYLSIDESYQELLNNSSVLITDFSSVFFDFAYLKKPVIYFHPENDPYHYGESYFDYGTMAFGEELKTSEDVFEKLDYYINNGCEMEEKYKNRVDNFFTYTDQNNCKRVYEWILDH